MREYWYGVDFTSPGGALTLRQCEVTEDRDFERGYSRRSHSDGWTIGGEVHEEYCVWVNDFVAFHPVHGFLYGDFEHVVYAETEEAFKHFMEHHAPEAWDYLEI